MAPDNEPLLQMYGRVSESYHNIDDFRMKLLGLLPIATGTGVFLLLNSHATALGSAGAAAEVAPAFAAIGVFGFLFTTGLFAYELFGIKRCHYLIENGRELERQLRTPGQFQNRPPDLAGFLAEPFASSVIYPASLAAWLFLAVVFADPAVAVVLAAVVLIVGCVLTLAGIRRMARNWSLLQEVIARAARPEGTTEDELIDSLHVGPGRMRRIVDRLLDQEILVVGDDRLRSRAAPTGSAGGRGHDRVS